MGCGFSERIFGCLPRERTSCAQRLVGLIEPMHPIPIPHHSEPLACLSKRQQNSALYTRRAGRFRSACGATSTPTCSLTVGKSTSRSFDAEPAQARRPQSSPIAVVQVGGGGLAKVVMEATEYLRRAAEAEEKAKSVSDAEVRSQLRDVAQAWRELARQAELLSSRDAHA